MAKARSPEYPAIGLKEAVDRIKLVYDKDYQNKVPKAVIAAHMGYKGLNGTSLPAIAALGKYGLLEGRGDETRVSDLALAIIAHPPGSPERVQALQTAASNPELFAELAGKFPGGKASDAAIRSYLLTQRFIPAAADTALRSYRETIQLVEAESGGYVEPANQQEQQMTPTAMPAPHAVKQGVTIPVPTARPGMRTAVFPVGEGDVTLSFPTSISPEGCEELQGYIEMFLKGIKRQAEANRRAEEEFGQDAE
jgi:hypothetical protein